MLITLLGLLSKICGMLGIVFMCLGVTKKLNWCFLVAGLLLLIYSVFLGDFIFIVLQLIFIIVTIIDMVKNKK
jgi:hypothetical protein